MGHASRTALRAQTCDEWLVGFTPTSVCSKEDLPVMIASVEESQGQRQKQVAHSTHLFKQGGDGGFDVGFGPVREVKSGVKHDSLESLSTGCD